MASPQAPQIVIARTAASRRASCLVIAVFLVLYGTFVDFHDAWVAVQMMALMASLALVLLARYVVEGVSRLAG